MKIYMYDHGWSGADILIASDKETAIQKLIDPEIQRYHDLAVEHDKIHDPQERHNPWWEHYENLKKVRETSIVEYEIVEGLEFSTMGEY